MILQPVVNFFYCGASRYTGYEAKSIRLELLCGHEQFRKASAGVPNRARCRECENNSKLDEIATERDPRNNGEL